MVPPTHRLSCRRHKSLATGSSGGRRTKVAAALSYNHASTWTGSHLTRKCLLLFSPDYTKESSMMFSYRRQRWPGTLPLVVVEADQWLHTVRANRHMWPLQMTSHAAANQLATDIFMRRLLMLLRTSAIEGILVKVTPINALAQNVNRILSVPGGHSFRQCLSTSEKSIIFQGVDKWADPFLPMFQLG